MLTLLGLMGSPRAGGNTDLLLEQALVGARESGASVEKVALNSLHVSPCQHCDGCLKTGVCIVNDDMQPLHRKLLAADRLVLASPIFFMGLAAQSKLVIDRCQALWVLKYILKVRHTQASDGSRRKGMFISVGGMTRPGLFEGAKATVKAFFACCDVAYDTELLYPGVDAAGAIAQHPTALKDAFEAGRNLVGRTQ